MTTTAADPPFLKVIVILINDVMWYNSSNDTYFHETIMKIVCAHQKLVQQLGNGVKFSYGRFPEEEESQEYNNERAVFLIGW